MNALRKCPFCGGSAELYANQGRYGWFTYCECTVCSARSRSFSAGRELPEDWDEQYSAERAADFWNRRRRDA